MFCGILVVLFIYLSGNMPTRGAYTWQEFQTAVEQEQIEAVEIEQNREIPTGSVNALLKDGTEVSFYVSNVADVEKLLQYYDLQYTLDDVPGESIFSNVVLPVPLSPMMATRSPRLISISAFSNSFMLPKDFESPFMVSTSLPLVTAG